MQKTIQTKTANNEPLIIKIRCNDECKNGHDTFAITGELYEPLGKTRNKYKEKEILVNGKRHILYACGCLHDEILKVAPELKIFVDLHLSDGEGVPMYAVENGFYWYKKKGINHAGDYLRLTTDQMIELETILTDAALINCNRKEVFASYVERMKPTWKAEANKAKEILSQIK